MDTNSYDLLVIGSGPAGFIGARMAAFFGKRVALVERSPLVGGAVANTGTLPSKTLRETAVALAGMKSRKLHGVDLSLRREVTVADLLRHEQEVAGSARSYIHESFADFGIELCIGAARFADPYTLQVLSAEGRQLLRGKKILIASGSAPFRPPEFPFDHPRVYDSDGILEIKCVPRSLTVIGGGVIGSEYACTFAALGTKVNLVDGKNILLPFLDTEVSAALAAAMERLGVKFYWNQRVAKCEAPEEGDLTLTLNSGETIVTEAILVAAGRTSRTEGLNLSAAGIVPGKRGLLTVNSQFRTEVAHIYAAGDVIGFPALASTSMDQARVAMGDAFDTPIKASTPTLLPYGIYTIPEASMVGETEASLKAKSVEYVVGRAPYARNARGVIIGDDGGFLKLLFRRGDMRLLGVHVLGEQATEVIGIGVVAMQTESTIDLFMRTCFNYPTLSDLYRQAALAALAQQIRPEIPMPAA